MRSASQTVMIGQPDGRSRRAVASSEAPPTVVRSTLLRMVRAGGFAGSLKTYSRLWHLTDDDRALNDEKLVEAFVGAVRKKRICVIVVPRIDHSHFWNVRLDQIDAKYVEKVLNDSRDYLQRAFPLLAAGIAAIGAAASPAPVPRLNVAAMSVSDKTLEVLVRSFSHLTDPDVLAELGKFFAISVGIQATTIGLIRASPKLLRLVAFIAALAGVQVTPIGPIIDLILLIGTAILIGWQIFNVAHWLADLGRKIWEADSEEDLDDAAKTLALVLEEIPVAMLMAMAGTAAARGATRDVQASEAAGKAASKRSSHATEPTLRLQERYDKGGVVPDVQDGLDVLGPTTATGSDVYHGETYTRIGSDPGSIRAASNARPEVGVHDVIVHGGLYDDQGAVFLVDELPTNAHQIAAAISDNPNWNGNPIRLLTCYGGCGPAQELSNILGVPVTGATAAVGVARVPGAVPVVPNGDWILFTPEGR